MTFRTQPRNPDGKFGEKPEVGMSRRLTQVLREALGHDGTTTEPVDDVDARLEAMLAAPLPIAVTLDGVDTLGQAAVVLGHDTLHDTAEALIGMGKAAPFHLLLDANDLIAAESKDWDPKLHPRDGDGQFINVGAILNLLGAVGGGRGTVVGNGPDNHVIIRKEDGTEVNVPAGQTYRDGGALDIGKAGGKIGEVGKPGSFGKPAATPAKKPKPTPGKTPPSHADTGQPKTPDRILPADLPNDPNELFRAIQSNKPVGNDPNRAALNATASAIGSTGDARAMGANLATRAGDQAGAEQMMKTMDAIDTIADELDAAGSTVANADGTKLSDYLRNYAAGFRDTHQGRLDVTAAAKADATPKASDWGKPYGGDGPAYDTPDGPVTMRRKGQKVRFFDADGNQVGPEQANVAPAAAYAQDQGWTNPKMADAGVVSPSAAPTYDFNQKGEYARAREDAVTRLEAELTDDRAVVAAIDANQAEGDAFPSGPSVDAATSDARNINYAEGDALYMIAESRGLMKRDSRGMLVDTPKMDKARGEAGGSPKYDFNQKGEYNRAREDAVARFTTELTDDVSLVAAIDANQAAADAFPKGPAADSATSNARNLNFAEGDALYMLAEDRGLMKQDARGLLVDTPKMDAARAAGGDTAGWDPVSPSLQPKFEDRPPATPGSVPPFVKKGLSNVPRVPGQTMPPATGTMDDPIDVQGDVNAALDHLAAGRHVRLNQPDEVATLLDELRKVVADAKAKGEKAPIYDLCLVSVPDTNLFCAEHQGIDRINMPQLEGSPIEGTPAWDMPRNEFDGNVNVMEEFVAALAEIGVSTTDQTVPASHLRASQRELEGAKVAGIAAAMEKGDAPWLEAAIFVTRDGYVIDGHHRWAAKVGIDTKDGVLGDIPMDVRMVDLDVGEALDFANAFTKRIGIQSQSADTQGLDLTPPSPGEFEDTEFSLAHPELTAAATPLADDLAKKAVANEAEVTSILQTTVGAAGGRMEGLKDRFKRRSTIRDKIARKADSKGVPVEAEAAEINDALRYTAIVGPENYIAVANDVIAQLQAKGYEPTVIKNSWPKNDDYSGVNMTLKAPDGSLIELQFHTDDSWYTKNDTHDDYEISDNRTGTRTMKERRDAFARMAARWDTVEQPKGWEDFGTIKFNAAPTDAKPPPTDIVAKQIDALQARLDATTAETLRASLQAQIDALNSNGQGK